ncbi:polyketide synthase [Nocardia nova SH22a]|uniref:Polyketide synthase n=1 Tax=Nocardia nova SH22a TaxID=1415166 RepID=W5TAH0_9NOCA|nr:type I polyketide synthase [Nocardia nova]AHH16330.1 polyketide synthase [Nocardia nova SH22a]
MQDDRIRDLLKKVSLELRQSRQELATVEHRRREPIAIVGIGCRFPGGADSPDGFWRLLAGEHDAIGEFPADRGWDPGALFDPSQGPGTSATQRGGFLDGTADFDAGLFGLSPREALASDPQHRLLLETTWQAFEHAGIDPTGIRGSRTGVFIGTNGNDYPTTLSGYPPELEGYLSVGNAASVASGRISYTFGVEGPALTIDTACSSSLVAAHLAVRSLRDRECDSAVIGGVTLMSSPTLFVEFSRQHGLAPDGRCKAFGDGANGTGWAEGAGVLIAERLSDAIANGRRVLAVIRGSAVNQDGASNGLTAPNGPAQQRVIEDALAASGLRPGEVDAVEAHGTGTVLGDPIEAHALMATYGRRRTGDPLWLGSVKSNIGHTQAAAGIAGLIKMVLALRHETLPRTLHADDPSSKIDWEAGRVRILDTARPWPRSEKARRAGISAFGVSGTNAHLIVEEAPAQEAVPAPDTDRHEPTAWLLSASSPAALSGQARRLLDAVADGEPAVADVTAALRRRALLNQRAVVVGSDRAELRRALAALTSGAADDNLVRGAATPGRRVVFVFPGQGSQWAGMAESLSRTSPEFAGYLAECGDALAPFVDWSLSEVLAGAPGAPSLERVDVVQPVLWAMMVSLARLWIGLGVRPDAVIGHSQGEFAAAHIAGALSLSDAACAVAVRSKAITALSGRGAMLTVALPEDLARARVARFSGALGLAAINGPAAVLISGDGAAVDELAAELDSDDIWNRRVDVDYASHSHHVDAIESAVLDGLAPITPGPASIPLISTVSGEPIDTTVMDARYWYGNLRSPVQFDRALRRALADGYDTVVEVSAHPVLRHTIDAIAESAEAADVISTGTLRRDRSGRHELLLAAARLHAHGIEVDWPALLPPDVTRWIDLPTYAFDRQRFWGADDCTAGAGDARRLGVRPAGHPLLAGAVEISASDATLFVGQLTLADHPWLADHAVGETVIVPGAAYVDIALWIGAELGWPTLAELINERPIVIGASGRVRIQVYLGPERDGGRAITFYRADGDDLSGADWQQCATGLLTADTATPPPVDTAPVGAAADPAEVYRALAALGLNYGPAFRGLREVSTAADPIRATAELPDSAGAAAEFSIHPALLDAALHVLPYTGAELALPFSWSGVRLWARDARELSVRVTRLGAHEFAVTGADAHGEPVLSIDSVTVRPTGGEPVAASSATTYRIGWTELPDARAGELSAALWTANPDASSEIACAAEITELSGVDLVLLDTAELGAPSGNVLADLHAVTEHTLDRLRDWLANGGPATRLVVLTRNAYAVLDGEAARPASRCDTGSRPLGPRRESRPCRAGGPRRVRRSCRARGDRRGGGRGRGMGSGGPRRATGRGTAAEARAGGPRSGGAGRCCRSTRSGHHHRSLRSGWSSDPAAGNRRRDRRTRIARPAVGTHAGRAIRGVRGRTGVPARTRRRTGRRGTP